jgi:glutamate-1-semialdehyde aminotransferase
MRAGGMHEVYGIRPDIVTLGKALGNGHPIAAIVGKKEIMQAAQGTFISSTYWTERIGFVAGLEVIRQFEEKKVADHIMKMGDYLRGRLTALFAANQLNIEVGGLISAPSLAIQEEKPLVIKTYFTQEMLKRGFLAANLSFMSLAHTRPLIDRYLKHADEIFHGIARHLKKGDLETALKGPVCHSGFQRLN